MMASTRALICAVFLYACIADSAGTMLGRRDAGGKSNNSRVAASAAVRSSRGDGWFLEMFDEGDSGLKKNWWFSGPWANGQPFDVGFDPGFYRINRHDVLELLVKKQRFESATGTHDYTAGEVKSRAFYGAGCYSVCMKPCSQSGTSSSFYAFSGQYDSEPPRRAGDADLKFHNEIDVEFVGRDTRRVQTNYFSRRGWRDDPNQSGASGVEQYHDLGFDAATEFHAYSFRWSSRGIEWYVDDRLVRTALRADDAAMPDPAYGPLRVTANVWVVDKNAAGWAGAVSPNFSFGLSEYAWIKYEAGENCNILASCGF